MMRDDRRDSEQMNRRHFLGHGSAWLAGLTAPAFLRAADAASKKIVVGVMGLGRGLDHLRACLALPHVEVAYVCDVDDRRLSRALATVGTSGNSSGKTPQAVKDFRKILDDRNVDALTIAAPNHWHAPAAILAMQAGKHVYVEKPGSHNIQEARWLVATARKTGKVCQMGNQRRSWPAVIEAMDKLKSGVIGTVRSARCWYHNRRPSIGIGKPVPVPKELDYALWQGPAPERPYLDNIVHYNWHWRWHWGGGELANNGIHALDLARWGTGVGDCPIRVTCGGGRYHFKDDQETPDTAVATFDFGDKVLIWDGSSCHPRPADNLAFVTFYGDNGALALSGGGMYRIFDPKGVEIDRFKGDGFAKATGSGGDRVHFENFFDCIRNGKRPHSDIEEGQKGTLLCHLGNIAYRLGRTLTLDPTTQTILNDKEAVALLGREYRPGWEPKV
ncbi:MAG: Gfo/Idh/MocA family oxidoreductase [Gemmataceae bacterium]|nr:Gfo/Idh/MocA family oxidoreductase [Gemmataceae bacterium]MDW8264901.1 Gfo/Idh/MocA family oxidoreductase [Gemmataceae bacterium]